MPIRESAKLAIRQNISSASSTSPVAYNSAPILEIADVPNQIAYCCIFLQMKAIARGPAHSSSISRYKIVKSEISKRPLASDGDCSVAIFKPHAFELNVRTFVHEGDSFAMNYRTSIRKVEQIFLSEFVAFSIILSWSFTNEGDSSVVPSKPYSFKSNAQTSIHEGEEICLLTFESLICSASLRTKSTEIGTWQRSPLTMTSLDERPAAMLHKLTTFIIGFSGVC